MSQFKEKVVLVTGGTGGQGASHAKRFIAEGADVVLTDIADDKGYALAKSLGDRATYLHHDVASEGDWKAVFATVAKKFGKLDVLVNNAGVYPSESTTDTQLPVLRSMIDSNQIGTFLGMQHGADLLARSGNASIINVSALAGLGDSANAVGHAGTKWAVRGMTKAAASELAPRGIRVNAIHPGFIDNGVKGENHPAVNEGRRDMSPMQRYGKPEELTDLVVFLASNQSSFITGAEIAIDGGLSA